jgi:hypothetical protein
MMPAQLARARGRLRYALDDDHRLVTAEDGAGQRLRPVRVVDGSIAVGRGNRLAYQLASRDGAVGGSRAVVFDGRWRLTSGHRLAFVLRETGTVGRSTLYFNGALLRAESDALIVALDRGATRRIMLSGRWAADARNRLTFLVARADGTEDRLTLQGGWEVGPHHALRYRFRRRAADGRGAQEHALIFEGGWDVPAASRLVYRLAGSDDSAFEFRAHLRSRTLAAARGRLVFDVGIGLSRSATGRRRVILSGAWKLNRDLSVSLEVPYAGGRVQPIRFEGTLALGPRQRVAVALQDHRRRPLGLTVTFTRTLSQDAALFLRLQRDERERSAIGGVRVRF